MAEYDVPKIFEAENASKNREVAPAGTGQRCGSANACHLFKGHTGKHEDWKGNNW